VMLPPGRFRLGTNPAATGSAPVSNPHSPDDALISATVAAIQI